MDQTIHVAQWQLPDGNPEPCYAASLDGEDWFEVNCLVQPEQVEQAAELLKANAAGGRIRFARRFLAGAGAEFSTVSTAQS